MITAAPIGAELSRSEYPNLPLTPKEMAEEAHRCWCEGASVIHVHARTTDGRSTQDRRVYQDIIGEIKARCDVIVQVSTGGDVRMTPEERIDAVHSSPDMATLSLGTVNFGYDVFYNPLTTVERFAEVMRDQGVKPELEVFDTGMIETAKRLIQRSLLSRPLHWSLIMGVPGGIGGNISDLVHLVGSLPPGDTWQVGGIGRHQLPLTTAAMAMGGHVRVGAEDNIYFRHGKKITSSAQLVHRAAEISRLLERPLAETAESRRILSLA